MFQFLVDGTCYDRKDAGNVSIELKAEYCNDRTGSTAHTGWGFATNVLVIEISYLNKSVLEGE